MRYRLWFTCAVVLASCAKAPTEPAKVQPPALALAGEWRAQSADGRPLPGAMQVFDPFEEGGQLKSIHIVADSARLVVVAGGRYEHRVWFSEWEGAAGGPPARLRFRWFHGDHGIWTLAGSAVEFESGWIQNHRMDGSLEEKAGRLLLQHGLGTGEPPAEFAYRR